MKVDIGEDNRVGSLNIGLQLMPTMDVHGGQVMEALAVQRCGRV